MAAVKIPYIDEWTGSGGVGWGHLHPLGPEVELKCGTWPNHYELVEPTLD